MEAKLIKTIDEQGVMYSLSGKFLPENYVLSLKNCQAIERGYDLDELVEDIERNSTINSRYDMTSVVSEKIGFREGFQKALELMGDKKFNEDDMYKMFIYGRSIDTAKKHIKKLEDKPMDEFFNDFIQSLQQTEWDVEIKMELDLSAKNAIERSKYIPELDPDGCLILKRI